MTPESSPLLQKIRALGARGLFLARLALRIGQRAVARAEPRTQAPHRAAPHAAQIAEFDQIIEALQTGDAAMLAAQGPEFATGRDATSGQPWLFHAIDLGGLASLRWFLAQGAKLTETDASGRTVLQATVERAGAVDEFDDAPEDPLPMLAALLDAGAAVNAVGKQGLTALHIAAATGATDAARLLLAAGADRTLRDEGYAHATALDYARQGGHADIVALLEQG